MPPLTRRPGVETTRKLGGRFLAALSAAALAGGGCATPGPNHVYLTTAASAAVHDLGPPAAALAGILQPGERAVGLAYDFNTDHLFVAIAPAGVIRVIERPSGKILRTMPLPAGFATTGCADLAVRSGDRHLFAAHPDGRFVEELTLFGETVRRIELTGLIGPIRGLAFDQRGGRLLVLSATGGRAHVGASGPDGKVRDHVPLAAAVSAVSLGYDSAARHFFVPLADGRALGEFDAAGALVRSHPLGADAVTALDAGPRSFVRVF
jgi:uncharacterized protein YjiK